MAHCITIFLALLVLRLLYEYYRDRRLPPGPKRLPFIGNIHQVPQVLPWRTFHQWSKKYGPIMSAQFGRQTIILIADTTIARDLLDKRGSLYSNRPKLVMADDNLVKGMHILLRQYDDRFRLHQRMEAPVLSPRASSTYYPIQDLESKQLLHELLSSNDFSLHLERYSISLLYSLTYGFRVKTGNEQDVEDARRILHNFTYASRVGTWAVDAIPMLNSLPMFLAPWKRIGEELFQIESSLHMRNMNKGLKSRAWNWSKEFSVSKQGQLMPPLELAYDLGILTEAGLETTSTVMKIFILATQSYPRFISVAQREIDHVVGTDRLPTLSDKDNLPYICAVVEETLRWRSIVPGGVPHAARQEDTYMGYRIPKDATIVPLHWSMSLDEHQFDNPLEFRPERWLAGSDNDRFTNFFGYGRRVCTGRHIARNSLFVLVARILWGFDVQPPIGADGKPKTVDDMDFGSAFVSAPAPFEAVFELRNEDARRIIENEWETTEKNLDIIMDSIKEEQKSIGLDLRG
ncbi:cytochrome P450 [Aspergillus caelatus]|uniref:Cytochrome P450 n=1 Tax=Aspergillus caelatus TaxID=61420 RepID=A0A5N7A898_9EURO|nr:cytochrome P450 [Aspergillus caelatus]KAE8366042.1 cytochrome P450 [Aspergillus caelatus]